MPSFKSNAIILRDVIESDLPIFYEQQLDPEATQMAAFPSRDRDAFMAHWAKIMVNENEHGILKTILFEGLVAGNVVSWEQSGEQEVGYWLGKEYWGKGIATKALAQFLEHLKKRPLYAHVSKRNTGSLRVLQNCGFAIAGENKFSETNGLVIEEYLLKME